jgi:hypothetical protein
MAGHGEQKCRAAGRNRGHLQRRWRASQAGGKPLGRYCRPHRAKLAGCRNRAYEPWDRERVVLDTATGSIYQLVDRAEAIIRDGG